MRPGGIHDPPRAPLLSLFCSHPLARLLLLLLTSPLPPVPRFPRPDVIVTDAVSPELLPQLLAAGRRVAPRVRSGELNSRMLTPLDGEPVFAEYYASPELLRYVTQLIERPTEQLMLAEFCVFSHSPDEPGNNGGWHRDAVWWDEPSGADSKSRAHDRTNLGRWAVSVLSSLAAAACACLPARPP
eukprot:SAG22_NODE_3143_length_1906_cov_1.335916_2_plen_185_part_00